MADQTMAEVARNITDRVLELTEAGTIEWTCLKGDYITSVGHHDLRLDLSPVAVGRRVPALYVSEQQTGSCVVTVSSEAEESTWEQCDTVQRLWDFIALATPDEKTRSAGELLAALGEMETEPDTPDDLKGIEQLFHEVRSTPDGKASIGKALLDAIRKGSVDPWEVGIDRKDAIELSKTFHNIGTCLCSTCESAALRRIVWALDHRLKMDLASPSEEADPINASCTVPAWVASLAARVMRSWLTIGEDRRKTPERLRGIEEMIESAASHLEDATAANDASTP